MYTNTQKTGLVLSGGGAKGAYQAGVLRALAEHNIQIDGVAGASIGALNGAIVAASPNLNEASKRLAKLWQRLAEVNPLQFNSIEFNYQKAAVYAVLLGSAGLRVSTPWVNVLIPLIQKGGEEMGWWKNDSSISFSQGAVFTDQPLQEMFDEFLDIQALQKADTDKVATPADWRPGDDVIIPTAGSCGTAKERMETKAEDQYCLDWFMCFKRESKK